MKIATGPWSEADRARIQRLADLAVEIWPRAAASGGGLELEALPVEPGRRSMQALEVRAKNPRVPLFTLVHPHALEIAEETFALLLRRMDAANESPSN